MLKMYKNAVYSILQQLFTFLLPLVVIPYISRILGPKNIGIYSYINSIVSYFMLFALLGITTYGVRLISKTKHNNEEMSFEFWTLYKLQLISTSIMIILYNVFIECFIIDYKIYFQSFNILLLSVLFDINWLYQGLEQFKMIVIRNILIKFVSTLLIFLLVKTENDLLLYIIIICLSTFCSQIYLFVILKKYVVIPKKSDFKSSLLHLKECLILFIPVLSYSIYRIMSKTMLGYFLGVEDLGYYENAEKLLNIPIGIIAAIGTVMIPAFSKKKLTGEEFSKKMQQSFRLMFWLILPMLVGLSVLSKDIVLVLFGEDFLASSIIIQLLSTSVIFAAIANIIRTNYLIPFEKNSIYVNSTIFAGILNFIFNIMLIPSLGITGACIGTIVAEASVCFYQIYMTRDSIDYGIVYRLFFKFLSAALFMICSIVFCNYFTNGLDLIVALIIKIIVGIVVYILFTFREFNDVFVK